MSTVRFQINPNHISHYISEKSKGGVCIEVTNTNTQETGWLYVGHTFEWKKRKKMLEGKVRWVASCYLTEKNYSVVGINCEVKTSLRGSELIVESGRYREDENYEYSLDFYYYYLGEAEEIDNPNIVLQYNEECNFFHNSSEKVIFYQEVYYKLKERDYQLIEISFLM